MAVLITGAGGGIGTGLVETFLADGHHVVAHVRQVTTDLEKLAHKHQDRLTLLPLDLKSIEQVDQLWNTANKGQNVQTVINAIGAVIGTKAVEELSFPEIEETFFINLHVPVRLSQLAAKTWMASGTKGRILNLSSIGVKFHGGKTSVHYSAAKAALESFGSAFARDWSSRGVICNTIRVGVTHTDFHKKLGRDDLSARAEMIPLKRVAQASEVAQFIHTIATKTSDFVTGAVIDFAGGE